MKILVSACLLGRNCKYNGGNNENRSVMEFVQKHQVTEVCPEVLGGLETPRDPAELVEGMVRTIHGVSVDEEFRRGAELALQIAKEQQAELAILQPRSPSCGAREIYDGSFGGRLIPGKGIFAQLLETEGIRVLDASEIVWEKEEKFEKEDMVAGIRSIGSDDRMRRADK